ncbi:TetR/AcrR family transcriptional regulator [Streptomyces sp. NPDC001985]|uniref:TetR/AcrR family transcriptional regulator n=1 Tax=Streptomyces sp. NPDC001985 TaxID=3154406 RepID=UPI00332F054A
MSAKPRAGAGQGAPGDVWFRPAKKPRTKPQLSQEKIVTAAVALLDAEGVAQLSMRNLAERLEAHATSLYWHVATKDDVVDLALDAVFAEVRLPAGHSPSWREDLVTFMTELRRVLLLHPWAAPLTNSRPLAGPHALARSEFAYASLVTAGFHGAALSAAASVITTYVTGTTSSESVWHRHDEPTTRSAVHDHLHDHRADYPTLAGHFPVFGGDWDAHFTRGMNLLLDGLAANRPGE